MLDQIVDKLAKPDTTIGIQSVLPNGAESIGFKKPWEVINHPADEYGFARTEYIFTHSPPEGKFSIIFVNPSDTFIDSTPEMAVVPKGIPGVIDFIQNSTHVYMPMELRSELPVWQPLKREVMEGITASDLFESNGNQKNYEDNEGSALLYGWLVYHDSDPDISAACLDELMKRRKFFSRYEKATNVSDISARLGEIPAEYVFAGHTTNFLPFVDGNSARILARVDTDKVPRWTVHTYVNGMVEEHSVGGLFKNSWEGLKYFIGMPFKGTVTENGLPANFMKADTFWSIGPGKGLKIPKGSFICIPEDEVNHMELYKQLGFDVIGYDPQKVPLRTAVKQHFADQNIPFIEHVSAEYPDNDDKLFAEAIGVRAASHWNFQDYSNAEDLLFRAENNKVNAKKFTEEGSGLLSRDEARKITVRGGQDFAYQGKPKKTALSIAYRCVRNAILDEYFKGHFPREALMTAVDVGII